MKKRLIFCICFFAVLFSFIVEADITPKVMVNGNIIDANAVMIDDRTYVPLRGVFEAAGAEVSWDDENQTAIVNTDTGVIASDILIPNIIEKVSPSVVGIIGKYKPEGWYSGEEQIAHGSGIIIKSGGEILTNAHVVKDMTTILVVMNNGKGYEAKLKYIDEESDLAVVKINKIGLPVALFSSGTDVVVGKMVIAIGTPITFSLRNSATVGYISGVNRGVESYYKLIQTDAAVNPGNSGGALVNMSGEIIGVTCSGYVGWGVENTSFAIPIDTVNYVLRHFEAYGKVMRASFKAEFKEDWLAEMGIPTESGLTIKSMEKSSPLAAAGFKAGNSLVSVDHISINSIVELNEILKNYMPSDIVKVGINNGGEIVYAQVELAEK